MRIDLEAKMYQLSRLAKNIRKYRESSGLTQTRLAERLIISPQSVSKWESEKSVPSIENLCAMAEIFHVSVDKLVGRDEDAEGMYVGIDGGGSKTELVLFTESGRCIARHVVGGSNPNVIGIKESADRLIAGLSYFKDMADEIVAIYAGCAGFGTAGNAEAVRGILKRELPGVEIYTASDTCNVIASSSDDDRCVAVISGTGSIVVVKLEGRMLSLGGWGYKINNGGGAYDIGREGLIAATEYREGFGRETLITKYVEEYTEMDMYAVKDAVNKNEVSYVASFAPIVVRAYLDGDAVAEEILVKNASVMADMVNHAVRKYNITGSVILSGGFLLNNPSYKMMIEERLSEGLTVTAPENPQVIGACILALRSSRPDVSVEEIVGVRNNLLKTYKKEK
jgi:N-acetylglucosamine kinase-like BadF-type ATPase